MQRESGQHSYEQNQFEKVHERNLKDREDFDDAIYEKVQFSDQQNIKCSIEIKNGIPQRSLNNFHKN